MGWGTGGDEREGKNSFPVLKETWSSGCSFTQHGFISTYNGLATQAGPEGTAMNREKWENSRSVRGCEALGRATWQPPGLPWQEPVRGGRARVQDTCRVWAWST